MMLATASLAALSISSVMLVHLLFPGMSYGNSASYPRSSNGEDATNTTNQAPLASEASPPDFESEQEKHRFDASRIRLCGDVP